MRVGLRGEAQADRPTEGRAGSKKSRLVALNGSTASSLGAGASERGRRADGASVFTTYGKYFQAIAAAAQSPTSTAPTGPINPSLFFFCALLFRPLLPKTDVDDFRQNLDFFRAASQGVWSGITLVGMGDLAVQIWPMSLATERVILTGANRCH